MIKKRKVPARTGFKEIEHPSDIGLQFWGRSMEELFENAGVGMFSVMTDIGKAGSSDKVDLKISVESRNPEDMLILWLEKLLYYFEVENMIFSRIAVNEITIGKSGIYLSAFLYGEKLDKKKHNIIKAIKAPTYHLLSIAEDKEDGSWEGTVIFDV